MISLDPIFTTLIDIALFVGLLCVVILFVLHGHKLFQRRVWRFLGSISGSIPRSTAAGRVNVLTRIARHIRDVNQVELAFIRRNSLRAAAGIWKLLIFGKNIPVRLSILARGYARGSIESLTSTGGATPTWKPGSAVYRWTSAALILEALTIAALILSLAPNGLLQNRLGPERDLGYMYMAPAIIVSVLFFGSALAKLWWRNWIGRIADRLLFASGLSVLLWSAFSLLPNTYILLDALGYAGFDVGVHETLTNIESLNLPAALVPIGVSVLMSAAVPFQGSRHGVGSSAASAAAWLYAGGIGWWGMHILGEQLSLVAGLGIVFFAASVAQSLSIVARHGVTAGNVVVAGVSRWSSQSRLRVLNIGILVGIYVAFVRPLIFEALYYPLLWEWLLGASIVVGFALLTGGQINKLRHAAEHDEQWREWRSHELKVDALPDQAMQTLVEAQRAFVEDGAKADLLVSVVGFLTDNRIPNIEIVDIVEPMVNYVEKPVPRLALWGVRRRVREENVAARTALLRSWTVIIQELVPQLARGYLVRESSTELQAMASRQAVSPV